MIAIARLICGRWLNHLSAYTLLWTASLGSYQLHWVYYNSISTEAWVYIFVAWIAIYVGTAVASLRRPQAPEPLEERTLPKLKTLIIIFSVAGFASCVVLARQIMREIDPNLLVAVTVGAPKIYAANFEETGQFTGIPYLGFLPLAASALAGAYAGATRRIGMLCLLPLAVATITGILSVSRFMILFAVVLFLLAMFFGKSAGPIRLSKVQKVTLALACLAGISFITVTRVDLTSALWKESPALTAVAKWIPAAPSLYFYVSGPPVGLSEYLREPGLEANLPWGRYTFASFYRFFSKLGLTRYVSFHQEFYSTPESINTCTYLREIYSDFGPVGIFAFPFALGAAMGWMSFGKRTLTRLCLLTFLSTVVIFSFSNLVISTGQWYQALLVCLAVSVFVERNLRRTEARTRVRRLTQEAV